MKKYFMGFLAIVLAIGFSAFTKKAPFTDYVYSYIGPSNPTTAQVQNRDNWRVKIVTPLSECTMTGVEEFPCSFETTNDISYLEEIGSGNDLYKPSTVLSIVAKTVSSKKVVDKVVLASDPTTQVDTDVDNIDLP